MSLDFSLKQIKDYEEVCLTKDRKVRPHTDTMIWMCLFVGIPDIAEKNLFQFFSRCRIYERMFGVLRREDGGKEHPVTIEEIQMHIGLKTNASNFSDAEFQKKVFRRANEEAARELEIHNDKEN